MAKKVAQKSRSFCFIASDYCGRSRPARFPKSESRDTRGPQNNLLKQKAPLAPALGMSHLKKFTRRNAWNGARRLKEVDDVIRDGRPRTRRSYNLKNQSERSPTLSHSNLDPFPRTSLEWVTSQTTGRHPTRRVQDTRPKNDHSTMKPITRLPEDLKSLRRQTVCY